MSEPRSPDLRSAIWEWFLGRCAVGDYYYPGPSPVRPKDLQEVTEHLGSCTVDTEISQLPEFSVEITDFDYEGNASGMKPIVVCAAWGCACGRYQPLWVKPALVVRDIELAALVREFTEGC